MEGLAMHNWLKVKKQNRSSTATKWYMIILMC